MHRHPASLVIVPAVISLAATVYGGDLNPPPGPVAPTMKPLSEVEPRVAIGPATTPGDANSVYKILQPGSYYCTGNIAGVTGKHGIKICADNVTIDLMGFHLVGVAGSLNGISPETNPPPPGPPLAYAVVRNGTVRNWGGTGVRAESHALVEKLVVSNNADIGVYADRSIIRACVVRANGSGIVAGSGSTVMDCTAIQNTIFGINAVAGTLIKHCTATENGFSGISTSAHCNISECVANLSGTYGIQTGIGATITGCTANMNGGHGIVVPGDCVIERNTCHGNGTGADPGAGISAGGAGNRVESNTTNNNDRGVEITTGGNLIIRNGARNNALANYSIASGNAAGPIVTSATIASNSNPHANYTY